MTKFEEFEQVIARLRAPGRLPVGPRPDPCLPETHLH